MDDQIKIITTFASLELPKSDEPKFAFLLDIDMVWQFENEPAPLDQLIERVEDLRIRERNIFELLIKDPSRELFDGK